MVDAPLQKRAVCFLAFRFSCRELQLSRREAPVLTLYWGGALLCGDGRCCWALPEAGPNPLSTSYVYTALITSLLLCPHLAAVFSVWINFPLPPCLWALMGTINVSHRSSAVCRRADGTALHDICPHFALTTLFCTITQLKRDTLLTHGMTSAPQEDYTAHRPVRFRKRLK